MGFNNAILDKAKKSKYLKDTITYYIGKVLPGLVAFFSIPLFLWLFGESVYGEYSLILSTILLLNSFITGWINQGFLRFYTLKNDFNSFELFTSKILLISNIITVIIGNIVLYAFKYDALFIFIASITLVSVSFFSFQLTIFQTKLKSKLLVLTDSIRALIFIGSVCLFYFLLNKLFTDNINLLLVSNICGFLIAYLLFSKRILFRFKDLLHKFPETNDLLKELLRYGFPLSLWFVCSYLLNISDRYIILHYYSYEEVGGYIAIYDLLQKSLKFLLLPILMALQPISIKHYNEDNKKHALKLIKQTVLIELAIGLVLGIILFFAKNILTNDVLKLSDENSYQLVIPVFVGVFLWAVSMVIHKPLELEKRTNYLLICVAIALVVNVIGNFIYIPIYGPIAAAYTTIIGSVVYLGLILKKIL